MSLDQAFTQFRDDNFTRFLRQVLSGRKKPSYMSGDASEFIKHRKELKELDSTMRSRGGLVNNLIEWSSFVEPIEATRFLMVSENLEEDLELLDATVEQERPATCEELLEVSRKPLPSSMKAIMLGAGGEARITKNQERETILKKNMSGLNLDAMRRFK